MTRNQRTGFITAVAIAAAAAAYFAYAVYQEREQVAAIAALAADTSNRLRAAIDIGVNAPAAESATNQEALDQHAAAVERHYDALHGMTAPRSWELARAADEYVLGAREIVRRMAASYRSQMEMSADLQSLRDHLRSDDRTGSWITTAVRAKERLDKSHRDYHLASEALAKLLDEYPGSRAKLTPRLDSVPLLEDAVTRQARTRVLAAMKQAADEAEKIGRLRP